MTVTAAVNLAQADIVDLQRGLESGAFTSHDLCRAYIARIDEVNHRGPNLRAFNAVSPVAISQAATLDDERAAGSLRGPLHGIPLVVIDGINTRASDGMPTTNGALALKDAFATDDAEIVRRLRAAGAIILGRTNTSEFGTWWQPFSPVGGLTTNPFLPRELGPGGVDGASGGNAVAVAAGLAAGGVGMGCGGGLTQPCAKQALVGMRTTLGLVPTQGVAPLSPAVETAGPMVRSVRDAALLLSVIADGDVNYSASLKEDALKGVRLGVIVNPYRNDKQDAESTAFYSKVFGDALSALKGAGANIVEDVNINLHTFPEPAPPKGRSFPGAWAGPTDVHAVEFAESLPAYLKTLTTNPNGISTAKDLLRYDEKQPPDAVHSIKYHRVFLKQAADATPEDYASAKKSFQEVRCTARSDIDAALSHDNLSALVLVTISPPRVYAAGYPQITVPLGFWPADASVKASWKAEINDCFPGAPVGITFVGAANREAELLAYAFAFEQATLHRRNAKLVVEPKIQLGDV